MNGDRYGPGSHSNSVKHLESLMILHDLEDEAYRLGEAGADESLLQHLVRSAVAAGLVAEDARNATKEHYNRGREVREMERMLLEMEE